MQHVQKGRQRDGWVIEYRLLYRQVDSFISDLFQDECIDRHTDGWPDGWMDRQSPIFLLLTRKPSLRYTADRQTNELLDKQPRDVSLVATNESLYFFTILCTLAVLVVFPTKMQSFGNLVTKDQFVLVFGNNWFFWLTLTRNLACIFLFELRLGLDILALIIPSKMNLESGPRFS